MSESTPRDLVVAGFGPSGIALAAAIEDHDDAQPAGATPLDALYLERAADSSWQPNQILPGTDIQHHFLRDIATPRDPRSRFTFPSFLLGSGRFYPFTLLGGYVSRLEWSEYVRWAAEQVRGPVKYQREVTSIEPVADADGVVRTARVVSRDVPGGGYHEDFGRSVVLAIGHEPWVPEIFEPHLGERVFHASEYLSRLAALDRSPGRPPRFAVVGGGQTAGEIVLHLAGSDPDAEVHSLLRHGGFRMYELGHFSNEAYFPAETDYFYGLDSDQRRQVLDQARPTNYSAVDPDVSTALYQAAYQDRLTGRNRLHMHRRTGVRGVHVTPGSVRLETEQVHHGTRDVLDVDAVILCTGYREPALPRQLEPFLPYLDIDADGNPGVTRSFRARTTENCEVDIYLDGITEWRHGVASATSFSQMAVKADSVHRDLRRRLALRRERSRATGAPAIDAPAGAPVPLHS